MTIQINVECPEDASEAVREVARLIDKGYTSGIIGYSGDTWEMTNDEDYD